MAIKATTATANTTQTSPWGGAFRQFVAGIAAIILGYAGLEQLKDGAAVNSAVPVPNSMIAGIQLPRDAYVEASKVLEAADPRNGWAGLARVEAEMKGGVDSGHWVGNIEEGLKAKPASARGWLLLTEALATKRPEMAADALEQSYMLAPKDYFLKQRRTMDAIPLWDRLDQFTRRLVIEDIRYMWRTPSTQNWLLGITASSAGSHIVTKALTPEEIRALNRYISRSTILNR